MTSSDLTFGRSIDPYARGTLKPKTRRLLAGLARLHAANQLLSYGSGDTGKVHGPTRDDLPREEYARLEALRMGREAGIAAGSWAADGNTSTDHLRRMIDMLEAGDPEVWDFLPDSPNLSGEWADDPTPASLLREILGDLDDMDPETYSELQDLVSEAWEAGSSETFAQECERTLRAFLPEPEEENTSEDRCSEHGHDECPDCGSAGIKMGPKGYEQCTRFLDCWSDPDA
jgi:hypothetical protein